MNNNLEGSLAAISAIVLGYILYSANELLAIIISTMAAIMGIVLMGLLIGYSIEKFTGEKHNFVEYLERTFK